MNKFQKERDEIFGTQKLSEERKRTVIDTVHASEKRKNRWLPAVVAAGIFSISSFLLFVTTGQQVVEDESNLATHVVDGEEKSVIVEDIYAAATLEQLIKQQFGNRPFKTLKIIEPYNKDNGALVINKAQIEGLDEWRYYFQYSEKMNDQWELRNQFPYYGYENEWTDVKLHDEQFFFGILTDETVENVIVGKNVASIWEVEENTRAWLARAKSLSSPVYFEKDNKKILQGMLSSYMSSTIPFIEANKNEQTFRYTGNTMYRGNKEYTEFPLLIDPFYYAENPYRDGDVVVIETLEGTEITRIIDTLQNKVTIEESEINLSNQHQSYYFYFTANYDGDTSIYSNERIEFPRTKSDEVFIHPDNWGSSGTRGPISKEAIKGKVIGYDLHAITNTMTPQDLAMFNDLQKVVQSRKTNNSVENTINTFLKTASAETVAKLYFYAHYVEDFETMYALLNQHDNPPPYEQWEKKMKLVTTQSSKQRLLVNIYAVNRMTMNTDKKRLEWVDEYSGQTVFSLPMVEAEGVWKITYDTIKRN